ncbi:peptidase A24A prepilin type IV [Magnetospirillum fulvum MGU-K5]|uniref:Peptidase A24A prepilin type IV n=1 Tax=Magnetospirillum fulvum MGU-K5 TaxID=1316936 RepID=S9SAS0_MAGFU|nr:peptidase A24A prepilin type IV [Magnetospirillum fulvum MGU-K5]
MGEIGVLICSAIAVVAFAAAALRDLTLRQIDNAIVVIVAVAWGGTVAFGSGSGDVWDGVVPHLAVAAAAFAVMLCLYIFGGIGGGDVKLAAVVFLWAGPDLAVPTLTLVALTGFVLALAMLCLRPLRAHADRGGALASVLVMLDERRGVPYGVALALGGIAAIVSPWLTQR